MRHNALVLRSGRSGTLAECSLPPLYGKFQSLSLTRSKLRTQWVSDPLSLPTRQQSPANRPEQSECASGEQEHAGGFGGLRDIYEL